MQQKSTRGVQQEDVWAAADALIAEGLRPTIERVRQKIGRGSPNTVSPLLETWFATLGPRLGVVPGTPSESELPAAVQKAANSLWQAALAAAHEDASHAMAQEKQGLDADRSVLRDATADLDRREHALLEKQSGIEESMAIARNQTISLTERLAEAQDLSNRKDREIENLRAKLDVIGLLRDTERRHNDEATQRHTQERTRLAEQAAAGQRQLLTELDRVRQQVKRAELLLSDSQRSAQSSLKELETANQAIGARLIESEAELRASRISLNFANERATELSGLLQQEKASTIDTLAHFNRLSNRSASKKKFTASPGKRVQRPTS